MSINRYINNTKTTGDSDSSNMTNRSNKKFADNIKQESHIIADTQVFIRNITYDTTGNTTNTTTTTTKNNTINNTINTLLLLLLSLLLRLLILLLLLLHLLIS